MQLTHKVSSWQVFREFLLILWRYRRMLAIPLGMTFCLQILWILPRVVFPLIVLSLETQDRGTVGFLLALLLINNFASYKLEMATTWQRIKYIRCDMDHEFIMECLIPIANKGMQFHISVPSTRVESRIYEADNIIDLVEWIVESLVAQVMQFVISFIPLAFVMPPMIVFTLVIFVVFISLTVRMIASSEADRLELRNGFEVQKEKINDLTAGNTTLEINGAIDHTTTQLRKYMWEVLKPLKIKEASHWLTNYGARREQLMQVSGTASLTLIVACAMFPQVCKFLTGRPEISIPELLLVQNLVSPMFASLWSISNVITNYVPRSTRIHGLMEMTKAQSSKISPSLPATLAATAITIEAIDLEFEYDPQRYAYLMNIVAEEQAEVQDTLQNTIHLGPLNFKIEAGQRVGVVGPTGSGKTTLFYLLAGLITPTAGQLLINGQNITDIDHDQLMRMLGIVTQDTQVLRGTVYANIALTGSLDRDKAQDALRIAHLDQELKLDTVVGERGLKLSGGQRQRLTIARAVAHNRFGFLFDEATAALDSGTEAAIQQALEAEYSRGHRPTVFAIAHRFATIVDSDVIMLMEGGKIVEQGSHAELMALGGKYARLSTLQGIH